MKEVLVLDRERNISSSELEFSSTQPIAFLDTVNNNRFLVIETSEGYSLLDIDLIAIQAMPRIKSDFGYYSALSDLLEFYSKFRSHKFFQFDSVREFYQWCAD
jgi:hypothetical protein